MGILSILRIYLIAAVVMDTITNGDNVEIQWNKMKWNEENTWGAGKGRVASVRVSEETELEWEPW